MAKSYFINACVDADGATTLPEKFSGETLKLGDLAFQDETDLGLGALALVDEVGNIVDDDTAAATDLATAQALANALQTKVNALLAALKAAGVMEADA